MSESRKSESDNPRSGGWWLTYIVAPIFVILFCYFVWAAITNSMPFEPKAELSYKIEKSLRVLGKDDIHKTNIEINNSIMNQLYIQPVCIWNSGKKDIKDLDISYYFNKDDLDNDFNILNIIHNTSPSTGFGNIVEIDSGKNYSREFAYSKLNKKDHFCILFLINRLYPINVESRTPDLPVNTVTGDDPCDCGS